MYLTFSSSNKSYNLFEEVPKKYTKFVNLSNLNMSFYINTNEASMDLKIGFLEAKNKKFAYFCEPVQFNNAQSLPDNLRYR